MMKDIDITWYEMWRKIWVIDYLSSWCLLNTSLLTSSVPHPVKKQGSPTRTEFVFATGIGCTTLLNTISAFRWSKPISLRIKSRLKSGWIITFSTWWTSPASFREFVPAWTVTFLRASGSVNLNYTN